MEEKGERWKQKGIEEEKWPGRKRYGRRRKGMDGRERRDVEETNEMLWYLRRPRGDGN